jgi:hypothetical protein
VRSPVTIEAEWQLHASIGVAQVEGNRRGTCRVRESDQPEWARSAFDSLNHGFGPPPGAFGITNRPDTLLNLVMDALDR